MKKQRPLIFDVLKSAEANRLTLSQVCERNPWWSRPYISSRVYRHKISLAPRAMDKNKSGFSREDVTEIIKAQALLDRRESARGIGLRTGYPTGTVARIAHGLGIKLARANSRVLKKSLRISKPMQILAYLVRTPGVAAGDYASVAARFDCCREFVSQIACFAREEILNHVSVCPTQPNPQEFRTMEFRPEDRRLVS